VAQGRAEKLHDQVMSAPDVTRVVRLVQELRAAAAPGDVVVRSVVALELLREVEHEICRARDDAICALHHSGQSLQQIREQTGLSRARLHQIIRASESWNAARRS
jgi:hypothetical protein